MVERDDFRRRVTDKDPNQLVIYMDASSLINMASLIDPQDIGEGAPVEDPTLLRFLEHLGKLGAKVIIPESVVFETTGYRANGNQLTRQFMQDIEHKYLVGFFKAVANEEIKNVSIETSPEAGMHLSSLEDLQTDHRTFNEYKRNHMRGFGRRDIAKIVERSDHKGNIFVVTQSPRMIDDISYIDNRAGRPINVIDGLHLCSETQKTVPMHWLDHEIKWRERNVAVDKIKEYINAFFEHDNTRRIDKGREDLNIAYEKGQEGFSHVAESEPEFSEALQIMMKPPEKGRY